MRRPGAFEQLGLLLILVAGGLYVIPRLLPDRRPPEREVRGFDPLRPEHHDALAAGFEGAGDLERAKRARQVAARLRGEDVAVPPSGESVPELWQGALAAPGGDGNPAFAAVTLAEKGELEAARKRIREVIAVEGETAANLTALGFIQIHRGDLQKAEEALRKALETDSAFAPAWLGRGMVRLRRRKFSSATDDLRRAVELVPGAAPWRLELASALLASGEVDPALRELEQVLRARPESPDVYARIGDCLLRGGREEEARRWYRAAIELSGPDAFPAELREFAGLTSSPEEPSSPEGR